MRWLCGPLLFLALGCASTVTRLDGEFPAPIGPARGSCEQAEWLVVAPTRVQLIERNGKPATTLDDGVALYKVGAKHPEPIPALADSLRRDFAGIDRRVEQVRSYDQRTWAAAGLGAAGLIAIGVGTALFVSAFKTDPVTQEPSTDSTQAGLGGEPGTHWFWLGDRRPSPQSGTSAALTGRGRPLRIPAAQGRARPGRHLDAELQSGRARPL